MKKLRIVSEKAKEVPASDWDVFERLVQEGARKIIQQALIEEVEAFLGRGAYDRTDEFRGYRNGFGKTRTISMGMGPVEVKPPRISDVPAEISPNGFHSQILPRYERATATTKNLLTSLYLEGLSSGDFEPVFRGILGENAPLSPSSIIRLKEVWEQEYQIWKTRPLQPRYAYVWVDGVYLKAGLEDEKTALLVVIGVNEDGEKELLTIHEGYRESKESWGEVLRDLKARGVEFLCLVIGDGHLGIWSALRDVFPQAKEQRCWNHKGLNVLDKLPERLHKEAKIQLRNIWNAPTKAECIARAEKYSRMLRLLKQENAAETLLRDFERMTTFYDFPQEHWIHLRTTNPIESVFASVRLRTNVTKRMRSPRNTLYLVFKLVQRLSRTWRTINAPRRVSMVLSGEPFKDGRYVTYQERKEVERKAA